MAKGKSTKYALLLSLFSLFICISMLIGSTFAWFTDIASTNVNMIISGTLKVDLINQEGVSVVGKTLSFVDKDDNTLWEPGCTYTLESVRVKNIGNLALSYQIAITGLYGDIKLNEAIEWKVNGIAVNDWNSAGALLPKEISEDIVISGHMREDAGNEYQNLSISGIAITVYATQYSHENDSYGKDYDDFSKNISFGKVAILSDSLAAYPGYIPEGNIPWYSSVSDGVHHGGNTANDVASVEDMWWYKLMAETGSTLLLNESQAGSPIGSLTKYGDESSVTFPTRMNKNLSGNGAQLDTIFILGGVNDYTRNVSLGELKYSDWTEEDLTKTLPSFCYILDSLKANYPNARIVVISVPYATNTRYTNITKGMAKACEYYDVDYIAIDSPKNATTWPGGHPNVAYMETMKEQIIDFYK